ncbi:MAG: diguanylate cyclase [Chitinivibrionales bacterium]|nr:diguanylate cyclase [Chitinivibrionales bacterium]MBD3356915.1 diguanylate cyclase [Chitinivibrionales bacterium]
MSAAKIRWGLLVFLFSAVLIGTAFALLLRYPSTAFPRLYDRVLPTLGMIFAGISLVAGHFSYPRVHNLKVYCAGYLTGMLSLAYFALALHPTRRPELVSILLLVSFANLLIVLAVPSYVKYRVARAFTLWLVTVELLAFLFFRYVPDTTAWAGYSAEPHLFHATSWSILIWLGVAAGLSVWRVRNEFHLGGVLLGLALIEGFAWLSPALTSLATDYELLLFVAAPLYLNIGILVHWLSRMEHRISYDPLLHIYNRNYCSTVITEQSNLNTSSPLGVAMIDIDHFKKVNDSYGHEAGDQVLHAVAQTILREVVPNGVACRYGGEEIIVFFPKMATKEVIPLVENVRAAVERLKVPTRRKKLTVTVSCGVSHRSDNAQSVIDVIHTADKALYRAKKGGRNQVKTGKTASSGGRKR